MFKKLRNLVELPSSSFIAKAKPSSFTPDLCFLEQKPVHLIFDHNNNVKTPCMHNAVYTDQKFSMWLRNHEEGTPTLLFTDHIHPDDRMLPRARVRGKLHQVTAKDIAALDRELNNRVQSDRKLCRIIIPSEYSAKTLEYETKTAWVYADRKDFWAPKFEFDFNIWRGRKDSAYLPAPTFKDERPFINSFFTPPQRKAHQPRMTMAFFNYTQFKFDLYHEEKDYTEECRQRSLEEKGVQIVQLKAGTPPQIT